MHAAEAANYALVATIVAPVTVIALRHRGRRQGGKGNGHGREAQKHLTHDLFSSFGRWLGTGNEDGSRRFGLMRC